MRLKLISCQVFAREMGAAIGRSTHEVDIEFLPKGLHDIGCVGMRERIQAAIDRAGPGFDAVLLGYGFCNHGMEGIRARTVPLVVPRAHDCLSLLLGGGERYLEYFHGHPGTYYQSSGWVENRKNGEDLERLSLARRHGLGSSYEDLVAKYGEEKAKFLHDRIGDQTRHYTRFTFIETGVEPDDRFERQAREEAGRRGWKFETVTGDLSMIQRMLDGRWDDAEFLVVSPGSRIVAQYDDRIVAAERVSP